MTETSATKTIPMISRGDARGTTTPFALIDDSPRCRYGPKAYATRSERDAALTPGAVAFDLDRDAARWIGV
jgi:hypothetical protein